MTESVASSSRFSVEEYLALDCASELRHEFHRGRVTVLKGSSQRHALVRTNIAASLGLCLKGSSARVFSGIRVRAGMSGLIAYPDIAIACDPGQFEHFQGSDTLTNPATLIEVLGPETEAADRGRKFACYRQMASLREYLLIAPDRPMVDHFIRLRDGGWRAQFLSLLSDTVKLASVGKELPLAVVYEKVDFDIQSEEARHEPSA